MLKQIALAIAAVCATNVCIAQTTSAPQAPQAPSTKVEAFSSKTGIVMIKGFTPIGSIRGRGTVSIDAREFRDASNPTQAAYGVAIEVKESGRLERESRSFVDYDELDSLVRGLEYISKVTKGVTQFKDFEAQYRTKGDFAVTVFSDMNGGLSLSVDSGRIGKTSAFMNMSDLETLKNHILEAKRAIEAVRTGHK